MDGKDSSLKNFTNSCQKQNNYFPYFIKLNQFTKTINDQKNTIRLGLTSKNDLIIEYFIENDPSNTFHKLSIDIKEAQKLNKIFEQKNSLDEIYNVFYDFLQNGNLDIKHPNESNNTLNLILHRNKENFNIILNKEKISFINEYNYELNEIINKLYDEVLSLKKILKNQLNIKNNNVQNEDMKVLMKENITILDKLSKIESQNKSQQNEINNLKKTITELKNRTKETSKNYLRKQDIINNINRINSDESEDDGNSSNNNNNNNNPYYNNIPSYYNNSYYYYQDYINNINNSDVQNINDYVDNYYYYNNNEDEYFSNNYESLNTA